MAPNRFTVFLKNLLHSFLKRPLFIVFLCGVFSTVILFIVFLFIYGTSLPDVFFSVPLCLLIGFLFLYPLFLTIANTVFIPFGKIADPGLARAEKKLEIVTILFGSFLSLFHIYFQLSDIIFADWNVRLYGAELHFPVAKEALPTLAAVALLAAAAYFIIRWIPLRKMPPAVPILCIAAIYLGIAECAVWILQIFRFDFYISLLILLPLNCILIGIRVVKELLQQYKNTYPAEKSVIYTARNWPWLGLVAAVLLLGLLVGVLTLCGQSPDSIINAWTDTADWNLSRRAAGAVFRLFSF